MNYFEVMPADSRYHSDKPLTYSSEENIALRCAVTVELRNRTITGFVTKLVNKKPRFVVKPIKNIVSDSPLPDYCFNLASWMSQYYQCSLAESLALFTPSKPMIRKLATDAMARAMDQIEWHPELLPSQKKAIKEIEGKLSTTVLLHGETGSGKTRVYVELAKKVLASNKSVIVLTPEITLTTQLAMVFESHINHKVIVLHSQLSASKRKRLWLEIINSTQPLVIIGARSALFSPLKDIGLVILDEAHEPAYKQEQSPRYQTTRVASQLGVLTKSRVVLGSATPSIEDYYLANSHDAVVKMRQDISKKESVSIEMVDLKNRQNFTVSQHLSKQLVSEIGKCLSSKKQVIIYLNRRGSSRLILCTNCGWQYLCPNCDIPLIYHSDKHEVRCHICNYRAESPKSCPTCNNVDLIYRSIGSQALADEVKRLFPNHVIKRFDGDNNVGERLDERYDEIVTGKINILVGTQVVAKGLDLPKLGLVGIVAAESSMGLPDFSSEERTFQLLYQVIGRVGRGHGLSKVIVQTYEPSSIIIKSAVDRDYDKFYSYCLADRKKYRFPPFSYLLQAVCRKTSEAACSAAANKIVLEMQRLRLSVEIIGPAPAFYARRGQYYYYQVVVKSKNRADLLQIKNLIPSDWRVDLDPANLL